MSIPTGQQTRAVLELVEVPRVPPAPGVDERAEYLPWLRGPQRQLEFVIDGIPLHEWLLTVPAPDGDTSWLGEPFDLTSVADLSWPASAADDLRRLAGTQPRADKAWPLGPGYLPLYVCPMCADLGCGAITVHVDHTRPGQVTWSGLRHDSGLNDEYDLDLSAAGTFPSTPTPTGRSCSSPSVSSTPWPPTNAKRRRGIAASSRSGTHAAGSTGSAGAPEPHPAEAGGTGVGGAHTRPTDLGDVAGARPFGWQRVADV